MQFFRKRFWLKLWGCLALITLCTLHRCAARAEFLNEASFREAISSAREGCTISLSEDLHLDPYEALTTRSKGLITIQGNGHRLTGLTLGAGSYRIENAILTSIVFRSNDREISLTLDENCHLYSGSSMVTGALTLVGIGAKGKAPITVENYGVISSAVGIGYFCSERACYEGFGEKLERNGYRQTLAQKDVKATKYNGLVTLYNYGTIESQYSSIIMTGKPTMGNLTVHNEGLIRACMWPTILINGSSGSLTLDGDGRVEGPTALLSITEEKTATSVTSHHQLVALGNRNIGLGKDYCRIGELQALYTSAEITREEENATWERIQSWESNEEQLLKITMDTSSSMLPDSICDFGLNPAYFLGKAVVALRTSFNTSLPALDISGTLSGTTGLLAIHHPEKKSRIRIAAVPTANSPSRQVDIIYGTPPVELNEESVSTIVEELSAAWSAEELFSRAEICLSAFQTQDGKTCVFAPSINSFAYDCFRLARGKTQTENATFLQYCQPSKQSENLNRMLERVPKNSTILLGEDFSPNAQPEKPVTYSIGGRNYKSTSCVQGVTLDGRGNRVSRVDLNVTKQLTLKNLIASSTLNLSIDGQQRNGKDRVTLENCQFQGSLTFQNTDVYLKNTCITGSNNVQTDLSLRSGKLEIDADCQFSETEAYCTQFTFVASVINHCWIPLYNSTVSGFGKEAVSVTGEGGFWRLCVNGRVKLDQRVDTLEIRGGDEDYNLLCATVAGQVRCLELSLEHCPQPQKQSLTLTATDMEEWIIRIAFLPEETINSPEALQAFMKKYLPKVDFSKTTDVNGEPVLPTLIYHKDGEWSRQTVLFQGTNFRTDDGGSFSTVWVGSQARREAEAKAAALVESLRLVKAKDLIDADGFVQFQDSDMHEAVCSALQLSENEKVPARRMAEITRLMVNRSIPMGRMVPTWSVFQLMPQLEELYLDSYASLEGIQALQLCPKLRSLYLFRIKKIPWDELTTLPELSSLSLVDMPAESLALEKIAQFLKAPIDLSLEQIEGECDLAPLNQGIDSLQLWKGDYRNLQQLHLLDYLHLHDSSSLELLTQAAELPLVQQLDLAFCSLEDVDAAAELFHNGFPNLHELYLFKTEGGEMLTQKLAELRPTLHVNLQK